jgi:hypothetical protein
MLISCSNKECGKWMHDDCLRHDALMRVYERPGRTPPQDCNENGTMVEKGDGAMSSTSTRAHASTPALEKTTEETTAFETSTEPLGLSLFTAPAPPSATSATKKGAKKEPYRGLFDATLILDNGPLGWRIEDLRDKAASGAKEWRELARCLFCSSLLD